MFLKQLVTEWLPAMVDVDQRLRLEPPARVADLGCGTGWSSLAIAEAYPLVRVDGLDLDTASIAQAKENAIASALGDRVNFVVRNAADPELAGQYALHCLPVGMVDPPAIVTGTVMRPATLRRYASEAGFDKVEILPIEHDFWRFYRLFV